LCSVKSSRDLQMQFAAVAHLAEGLNHETWLPLNVEKCVLCLVSTLSQPVSVIAVDFVLENADKI
jgi:hypothetical protein